MSSDARVLYLDASALVKLVEEEPESRALGAFLSGRPVHVSSALARVEVARAVGRSSLGAAGRRRADDVLSRVAFVRLDDAILAAAGELTPARLRTLDALHLATGLSLGPSLAEFVTYDLRLAGAAVAAGLQVAAPR